MKFTKAAILGTLVAGMAGIALSSVAFAGEEHKGNETEKPAFEELDANIDGVITEQEAMDSWLAAEFDTVDKDRNGLVNRTEYEQAVS